MNRDGGGDFGNIYQDMDNATEYGTQTQTQGLRNELGEMMEVSNMAELEKYCEALRKLHTSRLATFQKLGTTRRVGNKTG